MKTVFVDCTPELESVMRARSLEVPTSVIINAGSLNDSALESLAEQAEVLLVEHTRISASLLRRCQALKAIVFMGTGAGSYVPLEEAARLGIKVYTTPGYGNRAVAEHAMALMMSAARDVARMDRELRRGIWAPRGGVQLAGRKVAVLGLGEIGRTFAEIAGALGMRVAAWNRTPNSIPCFVSDLDDALLGADFVSLHLALSTETAGMIGIRQIHLLNRGAIFVNTARAGLVDEEALISALETGQIAHAALDVFDDEPLVPGNRWVGMENVTLTAHAAYMTDDAYAELWIRTMAAVQDIESCAG